MTKSAPSTRWLSRLLSMVLLAQALNAVAAPFPPDAIIGDWLVDSRDAMIHIDGVGDGPDRRYVGHIVWLKDDHYHPADGPALDGKPVMDLDNPDPALKHRPIMGLKLLWDLRYEDQHWIGGRIYDSDHGHTFDCTVQMKDADHLKLHAYVLHLPFLGGTTTWTRSSAPLAGAAAPPAPPPSPAAASSSR